MISDEMIRERLAEAGIRSNPAPAGRGISRESARRGTPLFDDLMDELEFEWELEDEELEDIVEIRRVDDTFEVRFKGSDVWELIEDEEEENDGPLRESEDFGGEEE